MDYLMFFQEYEAFQYLNGVVTDLVSGKPDKPSCLKMLKEISVEQLEDKAVVLSEEALIHHPDDVVLVVWIFLHDVL